MSKLMLKMNQLKKGVSKASKGIIREVSDTLADKMRSLVPYWHGSLQSSIMAIPKEDNQIEIQIYFYWKFVEQGHQVHSINPKLKGWIIQKVGQEYYGAVASRMIIGGAKPHPFVQPSIEYVKEHLGEIIEKNIQKNLSSYGFRRVR